MHSPPWNRARENWLFLLFIFYSFWKWKPPQITEYFNFLRPNHKHSPLPDTYSVYQYWKSAGCRNLKKGEKKGVIFAVDSWDPEVYGGYYTEVCIWNYMWYLPERALRGKTLFLDPYLYISITPSNSHQTGLKRYRIPLMDLKVERRI